MPAEAGIQASEKPGLLASLALRDALRAFNAPAFLSGMTNNELIKGVLNTIAACP